jgi:hypothetical protein
MIEFAITFQYNKMRRAFDKGAKKGLAAELIGNMGLGRAAEEDLRNREA